MEECSSQNNTTMQTRIQLTILEEDKDKLFDRQLELMDELSMTLEALPFPVLVDVFDREPEAEPEIEILYPS